MRTCLCVFALVCALAAPGWPPGTATGAPGAASKRAPAGKEKAVSLTLTSSAFKPLGEIPKGHTCDGEDVSPRSRGPARPPARRASR